MTGLLQPQDRASTPKLLVLEHIWEDISMDFIEVLPKVVGKSIILTVVVHLSKYA